MFEGLCAPLGFQLLTDEDGVFLPSESLSFREYQGHTRHFIIVTLIA